MSENSDEIEAEIYAHMGMGSNGSIGGYGVFGGFMGGTNRIHS